MWYDNTPWRWRQQGPLKCLYCTTLLPRSPQQEVFSTDSSWLGFALNSVFLSYIPHRQEILELMSPLYLEDVPHETRGIYYWHNTKHYRNQTCIRKHYCNGRLMIGTLIGHINLLLIVSMLIHVKHVRFSKVQSFFISLKSITVYLQARQRISSSLTMWMHLVWNWIPVRISSNTWRQLLSLSLV